jgi:hypothetical protein
MELAGLCSWQLMDASNDLSLLLLLLLQAR